MNFSRIVRNDTRWYYCPAAKPGNMDRVENTLVKLSSSYKFLISIVIFNKTHKRLQMIPKPSYSSPMVLHA